MYLIASKITMKRVKSPIMNIDEDSPPSNVNVCLFKIPYFSSL